MTQRVLEFTQDAQNEQVILAAALVDNKTRAMLCQRIPSDHFLTPEHRVIWEILRECERRKFAYDPATVSKLSGGKVDPAYLAQLATARPTVPENLEYHLGAFNWDKAKHTALTGPIAAMLEAIQDPNIGPERVRALAHQVEQSLTGFEARKHLHDPEELIREQMLQIRSRLVGRAVYPYGIRGLDFYETAQGQDPKLANRRMMPGAAPGQITVITGSPGSGKTTVCASLILGLARQKRKVLVGAWEITGGMTLELMAVISLQWSRAALIDPRTSQMRGGFVLNAERLLELENRMREISKYVRFLANPFRRRRGTKPSNEANLDLIEGYIADSGCEVFVADLWKRCLANDEPAQEELALTQQQAMFEELKVHGVLVQQQRLKDVEARADKRPTREGIKGSGAWVEVADTILGIYRPGLWKPMEDNILEIDVLKQRWGKWPLAVEFSWNPDFGQLDGGKSVDYEQPGLGGGSKVDRSFAQAQIPVARPQRVT